jgi:hypothetical protein
MDRRPEQFPVTLRRAAWLCWLAALATRALAAMDPGRVESLYARGLYPRIASALARLTRGAPFSLAEVLVLGAALVAAVWLARFLGRLRRGPARGRALLAGLGAVVAALGPAYLAFLLLWGLNYQRRPFATSAGLDARPAGSEELRTLCRRLVTEADEARSAVAEDAQGVMRLEAGLASAVARAGPGFDAASRRHALLAGPATPAKPVRLSAVLSYLGISGVFCPFTGEPNVNSTLPDPELPFVIAHETAHQRGIAREDEANYVASLACRLHAQADFRYSGSLVASVHALAALAGVDPLAARERARSRSEPVRRDLRALQAWSDRYRTPLRSLGEAVNDGYLRSQGQREGVRSYGRMVDLLIAEQRADGIR